MKQLGLFPIWAAILPFCCWGSSCLFSALAAADGPEEQKLVPVMQEEQLKDFTGKSARQVLDALRVSLDDCLCIDSNATEIRQSLLLRTADPDLQLLLKLKGDDQNEDWRARWKAGAVGKRAIEVAAYCKTPRFLTKPDPSGPFRYDVNTLFDPAPVEEILRLLGQSVSMGSPYPFTKQRKEISSNFLWAVADFYVENHFIDAKAATGGLKDSREYVKVACEDVLQILRHGHPK